MLLASVDLEIVVPIITNLALVGVTGWYVRITSQISKKTAEGVAAAQESALHSQHSAVAALRAAEVAEARLLIQFETKLTTVNFAPELFIVTCSPEATNIWVHRVTCKPAIVLRNNKGWPYQASYQDERALSELPDNLCGPLPAFLHAGETASFALQMKDGVRRPEELFGNLKISYSVTRDSSIHQRSATIENQNGLADEVLDGIERGTLRLT